LLVWILSSINTVMIVGMVSYLF